MSNLNNFLIRVKLQNEYDLIVPSLYNIVVDPETQEETQEPITDIEGTTALLLTDGTSWEFLEGEWKQIEQQIDFVIKNSLLPFIMQVCDSIHNHFIRKDRSFLIKDGMMIPNTQDSQLLDISGKSKKYFKLFFDDFICIETELQMFLTNLRSVVTIDEHSDEIEFSVMNTGLNVRLTEEEENIMVHLVMFPPQFLHSVADMLGYDLFKRESKEVRTERLGNYTYTNFEPMAYYGLGTYPQEIEDAIKYWQHVYT